MTIDGLLDLTSVLATELAESRASVRESTVEAIRSIETRLVAALAGERLRGLPNLGTRSAPFYAQRILDAHSTGARLPSDGREVLAIDSDGKLVAVHWRAGNGSVSARAVLDDEIVLEDLEPYVRIVGDILERFAELSEKRIERIERAGVLARRIIEVTEAFTLDK